MRIQKLILILIVCLSILLAGCNAATKSVSKSSTNLNLKYNYEVADINIYELTSHDVMDLLSKRLIKSTNVAVKGVKLGDRYMNVQNKLGLPDYVESYYDEVTNLKYEKDGITNLLIHLEDNTVTRIVVRPPMNDDLIGKSKIGMSLDMVTTLFGKPLRFEDSRYGRAYFYTPRGLEIYLNRKQVIGYGFVPPQKIV